MKKLLLALAILAALVLAAPAEAHRFSEWCPPRYRDGYGYDRSDSYYSRYSRRHYGPRYYAVPVVPRGQELEITLPDGREIRLRRR